MSTEMTTTPSSTPFKQPSDVLKALRFLWMSKYKTRKDDQMTATLDVYLRTLSDVNPEILIKAISSLQKSADWFPSDAAIRREAYYFEPDKPAQEQIKPPHRPTDEERERVGGAFKTALGGLVPTRGGIDEKPRPPAYYLTKSQLAESRAKSLIYLGQLPLTDGV